MSFRDWPEILQRAQKRSHGDPVTGAYYTLDGNYQLWHKGKTTDVGPQIAIAFDAATRQVLKHGKPDEVERYAINARKAYIQREDDIRYLVPTLMVVWMPPGYDADEINRVLANPAYLLKLMSAAQKVKHLETGDAKGDLSHKNLPADVEVDVG